MQKQKSHLIIIISAYSKRMKQNSAEKTHKDFSSANLQFNWPTFNAKKKKCLS